MSFTKYDSLRDRTVLITGGASGIGEEYVKAFAENGAKVAFFDLNEEAGRALTKALSASARHAPPLCAFGRDHKSRGNPVAISLPRDD